MIQENNPSLLDTRHLLELAIQREHDDEVMYREAARHIDDPAVQSLLQELASSEHSHYVRLEKALNEFNALAEVHDEIVESFE